MPSDVLEISLEHWEKLLDGQNKGFEIIGDENGLPILVAPPEPVKQEQTTEVIKQP